MIIDIHGHYTTAPKELEAWRNRQIAGIKSPAEMPRASELSISDDELRESIESNQLRLMRERGLDLTIFGPRASFMAHHIGDFQVSSTWAAICNELVVRVSQLFPGHFIPAAMLPQSPASRSSKGASARTARRPSTSTPIHRAAPGRRHRSPNGTGTPSTNDWS